jgi:polysaccharide pyruvyl transferase WcaK-like protein
MKFVLPRAIIGNLGDISSRWGVVKSLEKLGVEDVVIYRNLPGDLPPSPFDQRSYHGFRNLPPNSDDIRILRNSDVVLWAAGLDLQDDSSLVKLMYLWVQFHWYRWMGLRIWCLFQGAGPIKTSMGKLLARSVLGCVDRFVARDPNTAQLVSSLSSHPNVSVGHDGIFLPGFEEEIAGPKSSSGVAKASFRETPPKIGLNLRQWYHFTSGWLPYQFAKEQYRQ